MTPLKRKWMHAGLIALVGVLTDVGAQLASGPVNAPRAVLVGATVGGCARILGAILAAAAFDEPNEWPSDGGAGSA